ncbi:serine hydrolase domain-containing protein [Winogradskyella aurantia]|uniref:Beta-lactamase-related domain-containing protein n=1 Tax=Winogradskyella aurantia TaxID=1915063 RepID=A0A265USA2_9FLAO|nr:serine hydrolase domain-containing protein [Winogradskyella aurantia]OZV68176.1 hypothetical protein CA834_11055 [Winogradskyella aurantia]
MNSIDTKIKFIGIALTSFFISISSLFAQNKPENLELKIDSLFSYYDEETRPGIAIGIMLNDDVLLAKGYGLANLDGEIPISSKTLFNIGSVSKQFTAYAIAQLERQGKLSYSDDIRNYLPDLNDFGYIITIDNLLFHNSGIRGSGILRGYIEGKEEVGKVITQDDQLRLIYQQEELNFPPGTQNMYSNSGYILLSKIVEEVSEMSLSDYLKQTVFKPLEMHSTFLPSQPIKTIQNRAIPYVEENGQFVKAEGMLWAQYGSSGIYSNVEDLIKWQRHIHDKKYMLRTDPKTSSVFAMGLMLNKDSDGRPDEIFHFGSVPGYKSIVRYYPEINLDVITLSNLDNNTDAKKIASIKTFFGEQNKKDGLQTNKEVPISYLKQFEGTYLIMGDNAPVAVEGKTLTVQTPMGKMNLEPTGRNEFTMAGTNRKIVFDESLEFFTLKTGSAELKATRVVEEKTESTYTNELSIFTGKYRSPELNITNQIEFKDKVLVLTTASNQKIELKRVGETTFEGLKSYYYKSVDFELNDNEVSLFRVSDEAGWVQKLLFEKY